MLLCNREHKKQSFIVFTCVMGTRDPFFAVGSFLFHLSATSRHPHTVFLNASKIARMTMLSLVGTSLVCFVHSEYENESLEITCSHAGMFVSLDAVHTSLRTPYMWIITTISLCNG